MELSQDQLIFLSVLGIRFFLPLLIFRFPLPAIIGCLLIDAIDQTIFQKITSLPLDGYQSYDKALDIYYLSIAYISTMRNWTDKFAFKISQFLFYYRIIGVTLFELMGNRTLLLLFPNTFEYFFIFYEALRLFWDPKRFSKKFLLFAAAFIWIVIKLPQEYIIHVAQVDTTDWIKMTLFGVSPDTTLTQIAGLYPLLLPLLALFGISLVFTLKQAFKLLPPRDHKLRFETKLAPLKSLSKAKGIWVSFYPEIFEKFIFIGLVCVIFSQLFPSFSGAPLRVFLGAGLVITLSAGISFGLKKLKDLPLALRIVAMFLPNTALITIYSEIAAPGRDLNFGLIIFFALIITLFTVFYDSYRPYSQKNFSVSR